MPPCLAVHRSACDPRGTPRRATHVSPSGATIATRETSWNRALPPCFLPYRRPACRRAWIWRDGWYRRRIRFDCARGRESRLAAIFWSGIVRTSENFGSQGERPSASGTAGLAGIGVRDNGWRLKHSPPADRHFRNLPPGSEAAGACKRAIPATSLLARQARVRLPAELIRDSALAASGLLDRGSEGPAARNWLPTRALPARFRNKPNPFLANFDAPNGYAPVCRRNPPLHPCRH